MEKAIASLRKFLQWLTGVMDWVGSTVLFAMVLMLVYSVTSRKFGHPMRGASELSEYGLVIVVFLGMAGNYLKHDAMCMDTYVEKLPRKARWTADAFVQLVNVVILGLTSWRLFVLAWNTQQSGQYSSVLRIKEAPFQWISAVACVVLTVVWLVYLMQSLDKTIKAWRA